MANLPDPGALAAEIVQDLEATLEQFRADEKAISRDAKKRAD